MHVLLAYVVAEIKQCCLTMHVSSMYNKVSVKLLSGLLS